MKVVIIGQKWLAVEVLKVCCGRGDTVAKVITNDKGRLYEAANKLGIETVVLSGSIVGDHIPDGIDLIIAAHAHAFISKEARDKSKFGALGYHPSLLPRHRGKDAVRWTIHMSDPIAGGTVYWMDDGADTGNIAGQDWCHVSRNDDADSLWKNKLAPMGVGLIKKVMSQLDSGVVVSIPQQREVATWEPSFAKPRLSDCG